MYEQVTPIPSDLEAALAALCAAWSSPRSAPQVFGPEHWAWLGDVECGTSAPEQITGEHALLEGSSDPAPASADDPRPASSAPVTSVTAGATPREPAARVAGRGAATTDAEFDRRAAELQAELAGDAALLDAACAAEAEIARAQAARARALTAFAERRPASLDRPDGEVGAAARASRATRPEALRAVSEFCVDEVAVGLSMGTPATTALLVQSVRLVDRLPGTLAALEAGALSWAHAAIACELIAPLSAELRAVAEEQLVPRAAGRTPQSWRPMVRRLVMKLDADAIQARVAEAVRERKVVVYPAADGMATLCATLPLAVARAVEDALRRHAQAIRAPGDERSQGERMADCLVDLLLDPAGHGLSPVQAQLTVVASVQTLLGRSSGADGDEPGEIGGDVVPAAAVRELAAVLGLLPPDDLDLVRAGTDPPTDAHLAGRPRNDETGAVRHSPTCSPFGTSRAPAWPPDPGSPWSRRAPASSSRLPTPPVCAAPSRRARGSGHHPRSTGTHRPRLWRRSSGSATGAVSSPAAALDRPSATSTTSSPGSPAGPPPTTTWRVSAGTTTGSPTRRRAGRCAGPPTGPAWTGRPPPARWSPPAHPPTGPTATSPRPRCPARRRAGRAPERRRRPAQRPATRGDREHRHRHRHRRTIHRRSDR